MIKLLGSLTLALHIFFLSAHSQSVIGTSGTSHPLSTYSLSWTIGEPVTATFSSSGVMLTNGFHQSNLLLTALDEYEQKFSVKIYPNPTQDNISISAEVGKPCSAFITSLNGILLHTLDFTNQVQLDMSHFQPGTYILSLQYTDKRQKNTFKIIKIK